MARINTNVQSLVAQRVLGGNNTGLGQALERLSTGLRINRGADDPAGLIASENLRSEQKSLSQAVANADRADQVLNIAEGGLQEVSSLLLELQGLLTASASEAGLSKEEKDANQLQIDSILQSIDRIAGATNFQGIKLLNGNFDFSTSGVNTAAISDIRVNGAKFSGNSQSVNVMVTQSARNAAALLSFGAASLDLSSSTAQFVIEVGGKEGSREFSFASGSSLTSVAAAINQFSDVTGIVASYAGGAATNIVLRSTGYGSEEFVSVKSTDSGGLDVNNTGICLRPAGSASFTNDVADFSGLQNPMRTRGEDVQGTINGVRATGAGKNLRLATDFLDVSVELTATAATTLGSADTFDITGGGANFQLASKVDIAGQVSIGIQDVAARKLGNSTLGYLSSLANGKANNVVDGDVGDAQKVVSEAIKQVSSLRGRLGAFQKNVVGATIRSLGVNIENTAAAQSVIRDADFAAETASLTRWQTLVGSATNVLGLANQQPQSALQLLG
ncbi:MAG TPA: flagellin [Phycisphaerales bacterium]|nr:flagellin [Phycisphaerales bacterium]